jgi:hypothetical protein
MVRVIDFGTSMGPKSLFSGTIVYTPEKLGLAWAVSVRPSRRANANVSDGRYNRCMGVSLFDYDGERR